MFRLLMVLGVMLTCVTPLAAATHPVLNEDFERPQVHRYAINAVLGDLSFILRYGTLPPPGTDPDLRVRTHLEFVHGLLSKRDVSLLSDDLRAARRQNLASLRAYIDEGVFPRNFLFTDQNRPCFIDQAGRVCAAGYLVEKSAGREVAELVNVKFQSEFLWRMDMPELGEWVAASGLTLLELCMIQPCYNPLFNVSITKESDHAPAALSIKGTVYDEGYCCRTKFVIFDFGDGTVYKSPERNWFYVPVDIDHVYTEPGTYTIQALAMAEDGCGNQTGTDSWQVTLTTPVFTVRAMQDPDGSKYDIYLRTADDIRYDYLSGATVEWGDGGVPAEAGWYLDGDTYLTPVHTYSSIGRRTVVVTHRYGGALSEVSTVRVEVGRPLEESSWGRIKALFDAGG